MPKNNFIVVTSLSASLESYSFNPSLSDDLIYKLIENDYAIKFNYRLIQITLPRYFVHDYLSNVVLYHELGHFIDLKFKIFETIIVNKIIDKTLPYYTKEPLKEGHIIQRYYHCMEHFADLFAAQYIGDCTNHVLNYIAFNARESQTHPATSTRIKIVNDFLNKKYSDAIISEIFKETKSRTSQQLEIRFVDLPTDDFKNFVPYELRNISELHSIFITGWKFWKEEKNEVIQKHGRDNAYKVVNNLIEKSISNYIVTNSWNK